MTQIKRTSSSYAEGGGRDATAAEEPAAGIPKTIDAPAYAPPAGPARDDMYRLTLFKFDWSHFAGRAAIRRIPAVVGALALGIALHQPGAGVLAAATALSVGFAAFRQLSQSRLLTMVATTALMSVSAWIGSLTGGIVAVGFVTVALWALAFALLNSMDDNLGWVQMQATIALIVATAFPSTGVEALARGACVCAGGFLQIAMMLLVWRAEGVSRLGEEDSPSPPPAPGGICFPALWLGFQQMILSSAKWNLALRIALPVTAAVILDHVLRLKNGYWLPATTIIVLKSDFRQTYSVSVQRVIGTLAGVIVASVIAITFRPQNDILVMLAGLFAFLSFAGQKVNAVLFCAALTSYVIFMIEVSGNAGAGVMWHRFANTAFGCAIAMTARYVEYKLTTRPVPAEK